MPPLVLGSLRVLGYAAVPRTLVFAGESAGAPAAERAANAKLLALGRVPNLAIAESLDDPATIELLYCDGDWKVLASRPAADADAAGALAERSYPGIAQHWLQLQGSREDALVHYDRSNEKSRCSFCSKRAFQVALLIEGASGIVCDECVARFRRATQPN